MKINIFHRIQSGFFVVLAIAILLFSTVSCFSPKQAQTSKTVVKLSINLPWSTWRSQFRIQSFEEKLPISKITIRIFDFTNLKVFDKDFEDLESISFDFYFHQEQQYRLEVQIYSNGIEYNNVDTKIIEGEKTFVPTPGFCQVTVDTQFLPSTLELTFSLPEEISYDHKILEDFVKITSETTDATHTSSKSVNDVSSFHRFQNITPGIWNVTYEATRVNLINEDPRLFQDYFTVFLLPNKTYVLSYIVNMVGDEQIINGDNAIPNAEILSPATGTVIRETNTSNKFTITTKLSDDTGLNKVEYYLSNLKIGERFLSFSTETTFDFEVNLSDFPKNEFGDCLLKIKVWDRRGKYFETQRLVILDLLPYIKILSPTDGQIFVIETSTITISATASDFSGIQKVRCYIDGNLFNETSEPPFNWTISSNNIGLGEHTIRIEVEDTQGDTNSEEVVVVVVVDTLPPMVQISQPSSGSEFELIKHTNVPITVEATDNIGLDRIELFINDSKIFESSNGTLNYIWNISGLDIGYYNIIAKAWDILSNTSQTESLIKLIVSDNFEDNYRYLPGYTTGGNATPNRVFLSEKGWVMKVGGILNSQSTWFEFEIKTISKVRISFNYRVSSEGGYDYFRLYINSTQVFSDSGNKPWVTKNDIILQPGTYTIRFAYTTDSIYLFYDNCVYIDDIRIIPEY